MSNGRRRSFRTCERCGKKLIERLPNGMWMFQFGQRVKGGEVIDPYVPVEIYIHGSLKIKCLSRQCNHFNVFHYFPNFRQATQSPQARKDNRPKAETPNHASKAVSK
jgi:hypothetical protein